MRIEVSVENMCASVNGQQRLTPAVVVHWTSGDVDAVVYFYAHDRHYASSTRRMRRRIARAAFSTPVPLEVAVRARELLLELSAERAP